MTAPAGGPFGDLAPGAREDRFRRLAHRLPANGAGRRLASLLLGPAGGRVRQPRDVTVFGTQKARLHPYDNICEKRVYATPQLWEAEERAALAADIAAIDGAVYYFVDVGANVGLFTLAARAAALASGKRLRAACIEPDPEMRARLSFNLAASDATREVRVFPYAAARRRAPMRFEINPASRGMSRLDASGGLVVQGAPLAAVILAETGFPQVDALKIDIEGAEFEALDAFFAAAPPTILPRLIILEVSHDRAGPSALERCRAAGYGVETKTRRNAVLRRADGQAGA